MAVKRFPIYVVRVPIDEGCGHQHQHESAAHNCAVSILEARKTLTYAEVIRVRYSTARDTVRQQVIETVTRQPVEVDGNVA